MSRHLYGTCHNDECPACERMAEALADDFGFHDDWQIGQDRYERHIDERWTA